MGECEACTGAARTCLKRFLFLSLWLCAIIALVSWEFAQPRKPLEGGDDGVDASPAVCMDLCSHESCLRAVTTASTPLHAGCGAVTESVPECEACTGARA